MTGLQALEQLSVSSDNRLRKFGAIVLLLLLGYWSYRLLQPYPPGQSPWIFIDYLNLVFHEAGHWLWLPLGQFWSVAGGSITQLLLPLLVLIAFIRQKDLLGASFGLFWVGNNLINISYYISDAQAKVLPLLGGDVANHDWHWLLEHLGLLSQAQIIGVGVKVGGGVFLLAAVAGLVLAILTMRQNRIYV